MNKFSKPTEIYKVILNSPQKLFDEPIIIDNDELVEVLKNSWENLLYRRFKRYNILAGVICKNSEFTDEDIPVFLNSEAYQKSSIPHDAIKVMTGLIDLLAFDTKWLRENKEQPKELPERFFVDGEMKLKYGLVENGAKKLMVVFQSSWAKVGEIYHGEHKITHKIEKELYAHRKYQFFHYSHTSKEYDYVFLEDDFNYIYGWFMVDKGKFIHPNIQKFVTLLSANYEEVHFLGASKGGYGAYHCGKDLDCVASITLLAPIIRIEEYVVNVNARRLLGELEYGDPELLEQLLLREQMPPSSGKKISVLTGESDYQYETIKELVAKYPALSLTEGNPSLKLETLISESYIQFLEDNLGIK